jgi:hypothetical protein
VKTSATSLLPGYSKIVSGDCAMGYVNVKMAFETSILEFTFSHSSGRPAFKGLALDGRHIFVVYDEVYENTVYVVTAYEI